MMTREEVEEVITYCKKNDISYKARSAELGIPAWKFYDSKFRYALEQESSEANGELSSTSIPKLSPILGTYLLTILLFHHLILNLLT